jgi:hypothetical protein
MRIVNHSAALALLASIASFALGCSGTVSADKEQARVSTEALVARPAARLILTPSVVQRLQARAAAGDAAWTALKARCDGYATGTMYAPNGAAYPDYPNVGQGYQGEDYVPVIRALGLCYRTVSGVDATAEARYGTAGASLLQAMSTPVSAGGEAPSTDSGYGIRNYGVGMAFGFDWLYPALSASVKSSVVSSLDTWIDWYDHSGFINNDPIGNYFAGYFLAKTATALATDGDNPSATAYWSDVATRMWGQLVKPQYVSRMAGGGWPEGWEYGKKAVLNMGEALWATKTATGLDWSQDVPLARDQAAYQMLFAWPSLKHLDDQGTIHSGVSLQPSAELVTGLAAMLEANGDSSAAATRGFAADVIATAGDDRALWSKFLYGDPSAPTASYKAGALSQFASGPAHVGMRSSWDTSATWGALSGGAYIDASYSGEELFDAGNLSVVTGDQPLLINPTGWLPQNAGAPGEDMVYSDSYGTKQRKLYNTFFVADSSNPYNPGQNSLSPADSTAHVEGFEDDGGFVHARAVGLADQYGGSGYRPVSQFTRDLVYVRPGTFVLFDRTTVAKAAADQWLSFHTAVAPRQAATTDTTQRRFDVVVGSTTVGSIRTLLPQSASTSTSNVLGTATRLEVHAPVATAAQQWLSVVTASATTGEQVRLSQADGNVASGNMVGVELQAPQSEVVLFASDQAAAASVTSADYSVTAANASHVLVDIEPSSLGYSVTATPTGGKLRIQVSPGGAYQASSNKILSFTVSATGGVSAAAAPPTTTPPTTTPPTTTPPTTTPPTTTPPTTTPPTTSDPQTVTFSQGVNGYSGSSDVSIANLNYSSTNNATGTVYKNTEMLYTYTLDYTAKALIKFDVSAIPATASVVSASLAMTFESWTSPQTLLGSFLKTPWNAGNASFGWTNTGGGSAWTITGIGSGDLTGPSFKFSGIDASGYQRKSVALDPASVQAWVHDPTVNDGLVFANPNSNKVLRIYSSEATNLANRPTLSVTYR